MNNYYRLLNAQKALNFAVIVLFFIAAPFLIILAILYRQSGPVVPEISAF